MLVKLPAGAAPVTRNFLAGGGHMGERMRAHDWSASPLGEPETWPQPLRTLVRLILNAKQAMFVAWGPELAFLYNDDYAPIFGAKHPHGLGRPFAEVWSDIWHQIKPLVDSTLAGEAIGFDDLLIPMERHGYREEAYFTFSYNPVHDENGNVAGMFCAVTETTSKVVAERRLATESERLRELFHQAPGFMAMLRGPKHVFEMVNASYDQLVGHREIVGKPVLEALPELEDQGFKDLLDEVYRTGQTFVGRGLRVMLQREPNSEPEERFVDFVYQPIRDAKGCVSGIFAEGSDVTEAKRSVDALRESEARLRLAVDAGRMAIWEWDASTRLVQKSPELNRLLGFPTDYQFTVEESQARYYPGEVERVQGAAKAALDKGERYFEVEFRYGWPGPPQWLLLRGEIILDDAGAPVSIVGVLLDITDRERAREELEERDAELRDALSAAAMATYAYNHKTYEFQSSPGLNAIYGYPEEQPLTLADLQARYHPEDREKLQNLFRKLAEENASRFEMELRLLLPDQSVRWVYGRGEYVYTPDGELLFSRGVAMDVTARKKWEEHQQLLIHELNHRVKNTLATVQSIASQTLRNSAVSQETREALEARLFALSRAHDVLTRENWEGADLKEIVAEAMAPYRHERESRLHADGPGLRLSPRMALAVAMALQELATNAVKYGALSNATGEVRIHWSIRHENGRAHLHLTWSESGGPPVETPKRRGFGTRLIERSLAQDLNGEVKVLFNPAGVTCLVGAPLS
jgi:PAS domain S-box-containing protein